MAKVRLRVWGESRRMSAEVRVPKKFEYIVEVDAADWSTLNQLQRIRHLMTICQIDQLQPWAYEQIGVR